VIQICKAPEKPSKPSDKPTAENDDLDDLDDLSPSLHVSNKVAAESDTAQVTEEALDI
jgi:hypothetical protein